MIPNMRSRLFQCDQMLPSQLFSLSLFHTQSVSLSIFYSISLCLFLSLSSSVSVSLFLSLFLVLSPSISLSVSIALFLSLSMSFISLSLTHRLYFFFKDTKHLSNRNVYTHNPTLGISSVTRFVKMLPLFKMFEIICQQFECFVSIWQNIESILAKVTIGQISIVSNGQKLKK